MIGPTFKKGWFPLHGPTNQTRPADLKEKNFFFFTFPHFRASFSDFPLKSLKIVRFTNRKNWDVAKKSIEKVKKKRKKEGDSALFS